MKVETTRKLDECLRLLALLRERGRLSASEAAEALGISRRKVSGLVKRLSCIGAHPFAPDDLLQVNMERGRISLDSQSPLPELPVLTPEEKDALMQAFFYLKLAHKNDPLLVRAGEAALSVVDDRTLNGFRWDDAGHDLLRLLETLHKALETGGTLILSLPDRDSTVPAEVTVKPLRLYFEAGVRLLEYRCCETGEIRLTRLNHVLSAREPEVGEEPALATAAPADAAGNAQVVFRAPAEVRHVVREQFPRAQLKHTTKAGDEYRMAGGADPEFLARRVRWKLGVDCEIIRN